MPGSSSEAQGGCPASAGSGRAGQAPSRTVPSSAVGRTARPSARPRANFPPQGAPSERPRPPYLCCSPTSPSVITWGTSSSVGHTPEAMQPNTPHSSRMPSSSSSMAARGGGARPDPLRRIPPARSYGRRAQPTAPRRAEPRVPCRAASSFTCVGGLRPRSPPGPLFALHPPPRRRDGGEPALAEAWDGAALARGWGWRGAGRPRRVGRRLARGLRRPACPPLPPGPSYSCGGLAACAQLFSCALGARRRRSHRHGPRRLR